jgi:hypothetical protein
MQRTYRCDPIQVSQWKRQLLEDASELFTKGMEPPQAPCLPLKGSVRRIKLA